MIGYSTIAEFQSKQSRFEIVAELFFYTLYVIIKEYFIYFLYMSFDPHPRCLIA